MNLFTSSAANIAFNIILLAVSILLLWKGADGLVESAARIAARFGVSELVIGLTVVAIGTSAPEFAVTVNAALRDQAAISVGNIVGSNIFNLCFILGISAMVRPIRSGKPIVYRDGLFLIAVTAALIAALLDRRFGRIEGAAFCAALVGYLVYLFVKKEKIIVEDIDAAHTASARDYFILILGIAAVVAGGHFLVESSAFLARAAGMSEWVIGITIVAAGTSSPEMAASIAAALKGKQDICAGNLVGSNIFNTLGVLGVAGLLNPLTIDPGTLTMVFLFVTTAAAVFFMRTGWKISRTEGALLLVLGLLVWAVDFIY